MRMAFRTGRGDFPVVAVFNAEFSVSYPGEMVLGTTSVSNFVDPGYGYSVKGFGWRLRHYITSAISSIIGMITFDTTENLAST
jgi:hypothetical protein